MRGRGLDRGVAAGFAVAGFAVLVAPAVVMRTGVLDAGVGSMDDDVLLASILVGALHAALAWRRLRSEEQDYGRRAPLWIAALNALVALALAASLLLLVVLIVFPDEHLTFGNRGAPFVVLWAAIQLVAVGLAELTARATYRWLRATDAPRPA
jgi:hypothetical protein